MEKIKKRFFEKVNKTKKCWEWTDGLTGWGYGRFKMYNKRISAHRASWLIHFGEIPKGDGFHGTCVLHKCDNRKCVNPEHLFLGTQKDNIIDAYKKGRMFGYHKSLTDAIKKLNKKQKREIILLCSQNILQKEIAKQFGITQGYVSRLLNEKELLT